MVRNSQTIVIIIYVVLSKDYTPYYCQPSVVSWITINTLRTRPGSSISGLNWGKNRSAVRSSSLLFSYSSPSPSLSPSPLRPHPIPSPPSLPPSPSFLPPSLPPSLPSSRPSSLLFSLPSFLPSLACGLLFSESFFVFPGDPDDTNYTAVGAAVTTMYDFQLCSVISCYSN